MSAQTTPLAIKDFNVTVLPQLKKIFSNLIDQKLNFFPVDINGKVKSMLEESETRVRNDVLTFKDEIITEVKHLREEISSALYKYDQSNKRISRIEKHLHLSPIGI